MPRGLLELGSASAHPLARVWQSRALSSSATTLLLCSIVAACTGCHMIIPDVSYQPVIHNPFPQLSRVAVAPFFNQSDEPTADGRQFALAYFAELQSVPGFELVPLGVVEEAIIEYRVDLSTPDEVRRLAKVLGVDVVVIGAITDYDPYYPPRCGLRVEWYAANPGFHEIPAGYGLPWGTPDEEFIPAPLVFEAEMALAKAQLATQTPSCDMSVPPPPQPAADDSMMQFIPPLMPPAVAPKAPTPKSTGRATHRQASSASGRPSELDLPPNPFAADEANSADGTEPTAGADGDSELQQASAEEELPPSDSGASRQPSAPANPESPSAAGTIGTTAPLVALPPDWPDERGFIPPGPSPVRAPCLPTNRPVMTHTRIYSGHDAEFTEALASYYHFRDDARFGGWQTYLQRSEDFIRFCCHLHISEMLSARGGAGETRVVWTWSDCR